MLYIIIGTEKEKVQREILKIVGSGPVLRVDEFTWDPDVLRGRIVGTSLFGGGEEAIIVDSLSLNIEAWEILKGMALGIVESDKNVFIVESELKKEELEFFKKLGSKSFDTKDKKGIEYDFSPFALQDAIGMKSAKNSWIEYMKLRELNIEPEEIAPKIVSKFREMLAIIKGASKEDLGIKSDFPYNKSKKDLKNWDEVSLKNFYLKTIRLYHESRALGEGLDTALEKALLSL